MRRERHTTSTFGLCWLTFWVVMFTAYKIFALMGFYTGQTFAAVIGKVFVLEHNDAPLATAIAHSTVGAK